MRNTVRSVLSALMMTAVALFCLAANANGERVPSGKAPFLRTTVTSTTPYAGEEVILSYTLCFSGDAPQVSDLSAPALDAFRAEEIDPGRYVKSIPVTIDGTPYRSALVRQYRISALQPGTLSIRGYRLRCLFPDDHPSAKGGDVVLAAPEIVIRARPLPEPAPEGFRGAVGSFSFGLKADRTTLRAGDPLTITLTIAGTGNLTALIAPEPLFPAGFHQRPPVSALSLDSSKSRASGSFSTRITLYPDQTGTVTIPETRFVYFDPLKNRYRTLASGPVAISVTPAENTGEKVRTTESVPEEPAAKPLTALRAAAIALGALLAFLAVGLASKKLHRKGTLPSGKNRESVSSVGKTPQEMKAAIYRLIGQKGVVRPESLTRVQLGAALLEKGVSAEIFGELEKQLESIDRMMFSPAGVSAVELERLRNDGERLLRLLQQS